jgi:AraC-like DNA-binding protein
MLVEGVDATRAAFGYESTSQFTREYKRLFGQPPMRDCQNATARQLSFTLRIVSRMPCLADTLISAESIRQ